MKFRILLVAMKRLTPCIVVLALLACGDTNDTPDVGGELFQPTPVGPTTFDVGNQDQQTVPIVATNECGLACGSGSVCAFCFMSKILKCVTPLAQDPGAACTTNAACRSNLCFKPESGGIGRCVIPCTSNEPGVCGQPGQACLDNSGGPCNSNSCSCRPAPCGTRHSICSAPDGCVCESEFSCKQNSVGFDTCEQSCESEEDCPVGYRCDVDDVTSTCVPLGPRPLASPCVENTDCASGQCIELPGTDSMACMAECDDCSVCAGFGNGCDPVPTACKEGFCEPLVQSTLGGQCFENAPCVEADRRVESDTGVETLVGGGQCVETGNGGRCLTSCLGQADCPETHICRVALSLSGAKEDGFFCMPRLDKGLGDCCSLSDDCILDDSVCVLDGDKLICASECSQGLTCPPDYTCQMMKNAKGAQGAYCVLNPKEKSAEICNGEDDDLDGIIDEADSGGPLAKLCYSGPWGTLGVGICKGGQRQCIDGDWSECKGEKVPVGDGPSGPLGCDGYDNDCDGAIDEGCACTGAVKPCGLNNAPCFQGVQLCEPETKVWSNCVWGSTSSGWPTPEVCDGVDNDCDGVVDNITGQSTALVLPCGDLETGLAGVGQCQLGTQQCDGECVGFVGPTEETCDGSDNDCDGLTDEGCSCVVGTTQVCGVATGECTVGVHLCEGGAWGDECVGATLAKQEACDGLDNDCDGIVDNKPGGPSPITESCWDSPSDPQGLSSALGECTKGIRSCFSGAWSTCHNQVLPKSNTDAPLGDECGDMLDNDCDGATDEGCSCNASDPILDCGSSKGACALGVQNCEAGVLSMCIGGVAPEYELCNGEDDNCDGVIDGYINGQPLVRACYTGAPLTLGFGQCALGSQTCSASTFTACGDENLPGDEICNDIDDNCDGIVDNSESCLCKEGAMAPCGQKEGQCTVGHVSCVGTTWENICRGSGTATAEQCNGLDDDCDGTTDVHFSTGLPLKQACYTGPPLTRNIGVCISGQRACTDGKWTQCLGEVLPDDSEACDSLDNDCDGLTDEGCPCEAGSVQTCGLATGVCSLGEQACAGGLWSADCTGTLPKAELCNGLDDNCDGLVDRDPVSGETLSQVCFDGPQDSLSKGPCKSGLAYCTNGSFEGAKCTGQHVPAIQEICSNNIDDDCNGVTDVDCSNE